MSKYFSTQVDFVNLSRKNQTKIQFLWRPGGDGVRKQSKDVKKGIDCEILQLFAPNLVGSIFPSQG